MRAMRYGRRLVVVLVLGIVLLPAVEARAWRADVSAPLVSVSVAVDSAGDVIAAGFDPNGNAGLAAVAKFDGASGAELWRVTYEGTAASSNDDLARSVVVNAADDVFVAGVLDNAGTGEDLFVVKLAGGTGAELWRVDIGGTASVRDYGGFLAVLGGDVVASGTLNNGSEEGTVVRLAGATGAELWRYEVTGTAGSGGAGKVRVDGAGDVVVGLALANTGTGDDIAAAKLAGATGVELWRYELVTPAASEGDFLDGTAVDPAGDVLLLTASGDEQFSNPVIVTKVDGATGSEIWQTTAVAGDCGIFELGTDLALDASGNPVISGFFGEGGPFCYQGFSVLKFDGATGTQVWWHPVTDPVNEASFAGEVAVNTAGDVIAVGSTHQPSTFAEFETVVKLDGATGDERWRQVLEPTGSALFALVLDAQDDVVTGRTGLYKLSGLSGAVGPVRGTRIRVTDVAGQPTRHSLKALLVDQSLAVAPAGSAGDPQVSGAVLTLRNPTTLESATLPLPAAGWTGIGSPPGSRGYRYVDGAGAYGPCRRVTLKPKRMSVQCSGRTGLIPFTLDEPTQGSLTVSLVIGDPVEAHCATFGGDVRKDAGTANPGPAGAFTALDSPPALGACP
jgi:outer membrane protein assembly factor BamB